MVAGYSQRHEWPNHDQFTLCAWFVDCEALQDAMKAGGVMAKRKAPKQKRVTKAVS
ncbi:MAG: hypothetical protein P1U89_27960 [Verrucomicrobiales bacterium]|nr:hypothetical protein [Verrucomicrobiales bacterium]